MDASLTVSKDLDSSHKEMALLKNAAFLRLSFILSLIPIALAVTDLIGWRFNMPQLTTLLPNSPAMFGLTALGIVFLASTLLINLGYKQSKISKSVAWLLRLGLLAFFLLCVFLLITNYALGRVSFTWFFVPSPQTLFSFGILTFAFACYFSSGAPATLSQLLALIIIFLSSLNLFAHITGATQFYYFDQEAGIGMAVNTAVSFLCLASALLLAQTHKGILKVFMYDTKSGSLIRRLLLLIYIGTIGLAIAISSIFHTGGFSHEAELRIYATLIIVLFLIVFWSFSDQINKLETGLTKANTSLQDKNVELEHALNEVQTNEVFLTGILDALPLRVIVTDVDETMLLLNERAAIRFGGKREDHIGQKVVSVTSQNRVDENMNLVSDDLTIVQQALASADQKANSIIGVQRSDRLDWVELTAKVIQLPNGSTVVVNSAADITDLLTTQKELELRQEEAEKLSKALQKSHSELEQVLSRVMANEQFLKEILDGLDYVVAVFDEQGQQLQLNSYARELFELKAEETILQGIAKFMAKRFDATLDHTNNEPIFKAALKSADGRAERIMQFNRHGETFWLKGFARVIGKTSKLIIVGATDITEQVELQASLKEQNQDLERLNNQVQQSNTELEQALIQVQNSEIFLSKILDHLDHRIAVTDEEGMILMVNQATLKLFGLKREELIGEPLRKVQAEDRFDEVMNNVSEEQSVAARAHRSKKGKADGIIGWHNDRGQLVWAQRSSEVIKLADDRKVMLNSSFDVTEIMNAKKTIEEQNSILEQTLIELQNTEAFLYSILDNLDQRVAVMDAEGNYILVNKRSIERWGGRREDYLGQPLKSNQGSRVDENMAPIPESFSMPHLALVSEAGKVERIIGHSHLNSRQWVKVNAARIQLIDGSTGVLTSANDITEIINAKNAIQEQKYKLELLNQRLQQSNKELQEFAFIASHDLQEPLNKIRAFIDRLKIKEPNLSERSQEYISRMDTAATRMQQLIQDILDLSRVSTQLKPFKTINLTALMSDITLEFEEKLTNARVTFEDLPVIRGDNSQIRRLFENLLSNSIKYRKPEIKLEVVISYRHEARFGQNYHVIEFEDNGIGFDNKHREKIFTMFQRLHGRNEYQGTGVGLAICKRIAEQHHAMIEAKGQPGVGARFSVYFPSDV